MDYIDTRIDADPIKKDSEKKGFTRYSTGPKWSGRYFAENPAFWRTYQVNWTEKYRDKHELLPNGYSVHGKVLPICKSWNGFLLAKRKEDEDEMKIFAMQIRNIKRALKLPDAEDTFSNIYTREELTQMDIDSDETLDELRYAFTVPEL